MWRSLVDLYEALWQTLVGTVKMFVFVVTLTSAGVNTVVTAEVTNMPACKFQVQVQRS